MRSSSDGFVPECIALSLYDMAHLCQLPSRQPQSTVQSFLSRSPLHSSEKLASALFPFLVHCSPFFLNLPTGNLVICVYLNSHNRTHREMQIHIGQNFLREESNRTGITVGEVCCKGQSGNSTYRIRRLEAAWHLGSRYGETERPASWSHFASCLVVSSLLYQRVTDPGPMWWWWQPQQT